MLRQTIDGNILTYKHDKKIIICHQTNCKTTNPKGLSKSIFDKYPEVNIYTQNRTPGEIIFKKTNDNKIIANMNAQNYPGKPLYETKEYRIELFKKCIQQLEEFVNDDYICLFPIGIGCGLAGGDWQEYYKIINNSKIPDIIFINYKV